MKHTPLISVLILSLTLACSSSFAKDAGEISKEVSGNVIDFKVVPVGDHPNGGVFMTVDGQGGKHVIQLGPKWFQNNKQLNIAKGDRLMVIGVSVSFDQGKIIVPKRIQKIDK